MVAGRDFRVSDAGQDDNFVIGVAIIMQPHIISKALYLRSERSLDSVYTMLYSVFSLLTLQWIYPVAAVTIRQSRWLTR